MSVQPIPAYLQNASHSASVFRNASSGPWMEAGPLLPNEMWVAAQSTPNMSVQLGPGRAKVAGTQVSAPSLLPSGTGLFTTQGMYDVLNDATISLTIAASDPTNPRIDVVYVAVQDSFYSGSNNQAIAGVVTGTPAVTPVAPSVPVNAVALAQVTVPANATSITNGNIANQYSPAVLIGSNVPFSTYAHLLGFVPSQAGVTAAVYADTTASNNGLYWWSGSSWIYLGVTPEGTITTFGTGWAATSGSSNYPPKVVRNGNIVYLTGLVSTSTGYSLSNILTIPAAFQPPTSAARAIGAGVTSAGQPMQYFLSSGTVLIPSGYGGSTSTGQAFPLNCFWIMD